MCQNKKQFFLVNTKATQCSPGWLDLCVFIIIDFGNSVGNDGSLSNGKQP